MPIAIDMGDGTARTVNIDGFDTMSPEQQAQAVEEVHQSLASSAPADSAASGPPDTSFGSALRYGAHELTSGLGSTAQAIGGVMSRNGMPDWGGDVSSAGQALSNAVAAPSNYAPATQGAIEAAKAGNYGDALSYLPRAAAEAAAPIGAVVASGGVGEALGGAYGGAAAAAGMGAAQALGPVADARAANNGEAQPSTQDVLAAAPTALAEGALQAGGVGRLGMAQRLLGKAPAAIRPLVGAGMEAAGNAGADAAQQIGSSIDTDKGTQFDPYETAVAGAEGGLAKGAMDTVPAIRAGAKAASDNLMSRTMPDLAPPEVASTLRVNNDAANTRQQIASETGRTPPDTAVFNALKTQYVSDLTQMVGSLRDDAGLIDSPQASMMRRLIDQAQRHNNNIGSGGGAFDSLFDQVQSLDLPEEVKSPFMDGVRDLNTVSGQSFITNTVGPFQLLGGVAGRTAALGEGLLSGNPAHAIAGAALGHGIAPRVGGMAGSAIDRALGTNTPPVVLQAIQARRLAAANGISPGDSALTRLQAARSALQDPDSAIYTQLGIRPPGAPMRFEDIDPSLGIDRDTFAQATAAGYSPDQIVAEWKRQTAEQSAASAAFAAAAERDQAAIDKQNQTAAAQKAAQVAQAFKQQSAAQQRVQAQVDQGIQQRDAALQKQKDADLAKMQAMADAQARQDAQRTSAVTKSQVAGNNAELRFQAGTQASGALPADTGAIPDALSQRADMSGSPTSATPAELSPNQLWDLSGGLQGSPVEPSDPRVVPPALPEVAQAAQRRANAKTAPTQGATQSLPEAPTPLAATTPAAAPQTAPGTFLRGWKAYVHKGLADHGVPATASDIHEALVHLAATNGLDDIVGAGNTAHVVSQMAGHSDAVRGPIGHAFINRVASTVAASKGLSDRLDTMTPGIMARHQAEAASSTTPVRDPIRWHAARADAQQHYERMAALVADDARLAAAVSDQRMAKGADDKQAIAQAAVRGLSGARLALATRALLSAASLRGAAT